MLKMEWTLCAIVCAGISAQASLEALPPAYKFAEFRVADAQDTSPCGRATNTSATVEKVYFAQTHQMEPSWPLFYLAAERPALVSVVLGGTGNAPDVKLTAKNGTAVLGSACLTGPAQIPTGTLPSPNFASLYTMTLPAAWVNPGLSVTVQAGNAVKEFSAAQLKVSAATELNLLRIDFDVLHYNDGKPETQVPKSFLPDFAASMPASVTRLGRFPVRVPFDRMVFAGSADEPVLACRDDVVDKTGCADYSNIGGMEQLAAVLRFTSAFSRATGNYSFGFTYGNSGNLAPGGWGGGKNFSGADFEGIFLHEMGHALGLPHWGEGSYGNVDPGDGDFTYPYGGDGKDGGGRGQSWNYEPNTREFLSPICEDSQNSNFGLERSDAMQRNTDCLELRKSGLGPWDGFGDFSAISIHEFLHGNAGAHSGTVPYYGANPSFHLPERSGFASLQMSNQGVREFSRASMQPQEKNAEERYDFLHPVEWNTPVYTVYGTYHPQYKNVNILYKPIAYVGTLPKLLDPTDPTIFADLKAGWKGPYGDYFYWEHDVTLRFTYADGTKRVGIYPYDAVSRDWKVDHHPWRWDLLYFAISVPADKKLVKVEVFERPFVVKYADNNVAGNIAYSGSTVTPQNFLDGAKLMSEISFNDVEPPVAVKSPKHTYLAREALGGQVTVHGLDGRVAGQFILKAGEPMLAQSRQFIRQSGLWILVLKTPMGEVRRAIAIH